MSATCRGLKPWQVHQLFASELGRAMPLLIGSFQQAEEARRRYGDRVVGPAHSRGVAGVMPGESAGSLEGAGGKSSRAAAASTGLRAG